MGSTMRSAHCQKAGCVKKAHERSPHSLAAILLESVCIEETSSSGPAKISSARFDKAGFV